MKKEITAFWHLDGCSWLNLRKLERYFGDWREAWGCRQEEFFVESGISPYFRRQVLENADRIDLEKIMADLERSEVKIIALGEPEFPRNLLDLEDAPLLLYWRGERNLASRKALAVVGTRKNSLEGKESAELMTQTAVSAGALIVSGLAFGIDAIAHQAALAAGGTTWGVLASGILHCTPAGNYSLAERMLANGGALISEYPCTQSALKYCYLTRNRLIAGLADATLVVEAAEKSGAVRTGNYALEYGRNLLVMPGKWNYPNTKGCLNLINAGGRALTSTSDILEALKISVKNQKLAMNISIEEKLMLGEIASGRNSWSELVNSGIGEGESLLILSNLEIAGLISRQGEKWHLKANH